MLLEAVVDRRVQAVDRLDHDVAAFAAVAADGAAEFDELLAPKRDAAVAAGAGLHMVTVASSRNFMALAYM